VPAILLIIALVIPLITISRVHCDEIQVELHYRYEYTHRNVGSEEVTSTSETYEVSVAATLDNLSLALSGEVVREYPVWVNVSTLSVGDTIQLTDQALTIMSSSERYGFYCWEAETHNGTKVYYHKELGIFLGYSYYDSAWLGGTNWAWTGYDIDMTYENLHEFYSVDYVFNSDALLLSLVLIESVVVITLLNKRTTRGLAFRKS
jgi:hypothetical protein